MVNSMQPLENSRWLFQLQIYSFRPVLPSAHLLQAASYSNCRFSSSRPILLNADLLQRRRPLSGYMIVGETDFKSFQYEY